MNAVISGAVSSSFTGNASMVNVGFLDDQSGGWTSVEARGVIVFNNEAPYKFTIPADSTNNHAYVVLNKIRTNGYGINIQGAGVVDLRNVPDAQISGYGSYDLNGGRYSGLLIFKNKAVARSMNADTSEYKAIAILDTDGTSKAIDSASVASVSPPWPWTPPTLAAVGSANPSNWMARANTVLDNANYAGGGLPANMDPTPAAPSIWSSSDFNSLGENATPSPLWP
jgi:hypothetical protein